MGFFADVGPLTVFVSHQARVFHCQTANALILMTRFPPPV